MPSFVPFSDGTLDISLGNQSHDEGEPSEQRDATPLDALLNELETEGCTSVRALKDRVEQVNFQIKPNLEIDQSQLPDIHLYDTESGTDQNARIDTDGRTPFYSSAGWKWVHCHIIGWNQFSCQYSIQLTEDGVAFKQVHAMVSTSNIYVSCMRRSTEATVGSPFENTERYNRPLTLTLALTVFPFCLLFLPGILVAPIRFRQQAAFLPKIY
jgi:hypothetical protein